MLGPLPSPHLPPSSTMGPCPFPHRKKQKRANGEPPAIISSREGLGEPSPFSMPAGRTLSPRRSPWALQAPPTPSGSGAQTEPPQAMRRRPLPSDCRSHRLQWPGPAPPGRRGSGGGELRSSKGGACRPAPFSRLPCGLLPGAQRPGSALWPVPVCGTR